MSSTRLGLPLDTECVLRVRQARLELTDDRPEEAGGEETWPERPGRVLPDGRQLSQCCPHRGGHTAELPPDLFGDCVRSIMRRQPGRLCCICCGTESVRAHVSNPCGLRCCLGGGRRGTTASTSGASCDEAAANLFCGGELATRERPGPSDRITRAIVLGGFGLEQRKNPLGTVRRPCGDDSSVRFTQRLRRRHTETLPFVFGHDNARQHVVANSAARARVRVGRACNAVSLWAGPLCERCRGQVVLVDGVCREQHRHRLRVPLLPESR